MTQKIISAYRNYNQIRADVLTITQNSGMSGIQVTPLCQTANTSHSRLRTLLSTLTGTGLINKIEYDGKNTFVITPKGIQFLAEYKRFSDIAGSFGLEM